MHYKNRHQGRRRQRRGGFSLVEILVVISLIGALTGVSVLSFGEVSGAATNKAAKRNAQEICNLHNHALLAGTEFGTTDEGEIIDALVVGVTGDLIAGSVFRMSDLSDDEKIAALFYCAFDGSTGMMIYYPEGAPGPP